MRTLAHRLLWLTILAVLAACQPAAPVLTPTRPPQRTPAPTLPPEPDPSFALHFEYGVCYTHVLDTAAGRYRREAQGEPTIEVPVVVRDEDLDMIYAKLREIDFLSYPAHFRVPVPTDGIVVEVMPSTTYRLTVSAGDRRHTVEWIDDQPYSPDPAALRLRELFLLMSSVVRDMPEVRVVPTPRLFCV